MRSPRSKLTGLVSVGGDLRVAGSRTLQGLLLPSLESVGGGLKILDTDS